MSEIDLHRLLSQYPFESVLWIGAASQTAGEEPGVEIESLAAEALNHPEDIKGRWDLVIMDEDTLKLPRKQLIRAIGNIRDLHARRLILRLPEPPPDDAGIDHSDLISLGLHSLKGQPGIFYHDLYDYKQTPDWLNDQYWANPENWDKYRW